MLTHPYRNLTAPPPATGASEDGCLLCKARRALADVRLGSLILAALGVVTLLATMSTVALAIHTIRLGEQMLALTNAVAKEPRRHDGKATAPKPQATTAPPSAVARAVPVSTPKPSLAGPTAQGAVDGPPHPPAASFRLGPLPRDVDHSVIDAALEEQADRTLTRRFTPPRAEGELLGAEVGALSPGSARARLGFESGDVLWTVNGYYVSSPEELLEAYARLGRASDLEVLFTRKGALRVLRFHVR